MNNKNKSIAFALVLLGSSSCMAQSDDEGPQSFSYVTYHVCDLATQTQLDEVVEQFDKPVLDKAVEDGRVQTCRGYALRRT